MLAGIIYFDTSFQAVQNDILDMVIDNFVFVLHHSKHMLYLIRINFLVKLSISCKARENPKTQLVPSGSRLENCAISYSIILTLVDQKIRSTLSPFLSQIVNK